MNESEVDQTKRRTDGIEGHRKRQRHTLVDFLYNCFRLVVVLLVVVFYS